MPIGLNGHLSIRDSILTSCQQKGSYLHIKRPTDDTPNFVKIGPLVLEKKIIANNDGCQPTAISHLSCTGDLTNIRMGAMQFSAFHHVHVCKENQIIITSTSRCLFVCLLCSPNEVWEHIVFTLFLTIIIIILFFLLSSLNFFVRECSH